MALFLCLQGELYGEPVTAIQIRHAGLAQSLTSLRHPRHALADGSIYKASQLLLTCRIFASALRAGQDASHHDFARYTSVIERANHSSNDTAQNGTAGSLPARQRRSGRRRRHSRTHNRSLSWKALERGRAAHADPRRGDPSHSGSQTPADGQAWGSNDARSDAPVALRPEAARSLSVFTRRQTGSGAGAGAGAPAPSESPHAAIHRALYLSPAAPRRPRPSCIVRWATRRARGRPSRFP